MKKIFLTLLLCTCFARASAEEAQEISNPDSCIITNEAGAIIKKQAYNYNEEGKLIETINLFRDDWKENSANRTTYYYNTEGEHLPWKYDYWNGTNWIPTKEIIPHVIKRDEKGRIYEEFTYQSDNSLHTNFLLREEFYYTYDDRGNLIKKLYRVHKQKWDDGWGST